MPRLTENERNRLIGQLDAGLTVSEVARRFNVQRRVVREWRRRFQETETVADLPRTGRPRVTTAAEDRHIRLQHLRNRFRTAQSTADNFPGQQNISNNTVLRRLAEEGITAHRPVVRPSLTRDHRRNRLEWAETHRRWTMLQWSNVAWSDESSFLLERRDGRVRVYRRRGERFAPNCIREVGNRGRGSVMVWGAVTANFRTACVRVQGNLTAQRYVDEILRPYVIPFITQHPELTFMQDNAPPHRAHLTTTFLNDNGVHLLAPWPANSPDLNPIEHLWDIMDRNLRAQERQPQNAEELAESLETIWNNIPQESIRRLTLSMRRRCTAVIVNNGGHTRY